MTAQGSSRMVSGHLKADKVFGSPGGSEVKASACNVEDLGSKRSPGEVHGNLLQYSCLENSMDRGDWGATVHGVTKCQTQLKQFSTAHTQSPLGNKS